jgi:type IV secretion system protein VirB4
MAFPAHGAFRGPDLDSATQGELIATSARLNNALRRLGSGWALFIEAERRGRRLSALRLSRTAVLAGG